ncbi:DUF4304 domain-containing protein [Oscillospiraceae bacterium 38-13]
MSTPSWRTEGPHLDARFRELLSRLREELGPQGWRKEGPSFRFFAPDGLCRIINFQKSRQNHSERLEFFINLGVYFEKDREVVNRRFKEYECILRQRLNPDGPGQEWRVQPETEELFQDLRAALTRARDWFSLFPTKEETIESILSGEAQKNSGTIVMHYFTARLLTDMGYGDRVYAQIRDSKAPMLAELANQIRN